MAPVYAAGEQPIPGAERDDLVTGLKSRGHRNAMALDKSEDLAGLVKGLAQAGRLCDLPWRRQYHPVGLCVAGRARGVVREGCLMFPDMTGSLRSAMPELRGKLEANAPTAPLSWFRTGGPAQVLYTPADDDDLAYFLRQLDSDTPLLVVGLGSNLLIRDGGFAGIVIRLGKSFSDISILPDHRVRAGAGAPDVKVARAAAEAGIAGLSFLRGIPGTIGGALRMNGGAYGGETKDVLVEATGVSAPRRARVLHQSADGVHLPPHAAFPTT